MRLLLPSVCASLALAFSAAACGGASEEAAPTSTATAGATVDADALDAHLMPTGNERALLVNFWATW